MSKNVRFLESYITVVYLEGGVEYNITIEDFQSIQFFVKVAVNKSMKASLALEEKQPFKEFF